MLERPSSAARATSRSPTASRAIYTPVVHLAALATFLGWLLAGRALAAGADYRGLGPHHHLPLRARARGAGGAGRGGGRLFRRGILLKSADRLERLAEIDTVVFDKTGTLTLGRPELARRPRSIPRHACRGRGARRSSRHPFARALVRAASAGSAASWRATGVEETPGEGLALAHACG